MTTTSIDFLISKQSLSWALTQLEDAMSGRKERFKALSGNHAMLQEAQCAVLLLAYRKLTAAERSACGEHTLALNWVNTDPALADAGNKLTRHGVDFNDIAILPAEFLQGQATQEAPADQDHYTMDLFAGLDKPS